MRAVGQGESEKSGRTGSLRTACDIIISHPKGVVNQKPEKEAATERGREEKPKPGRQDGQLTDLFPKKSPIGIDFPAENRYNNERTDH